MVRVESLPKLLLLVEALARAPSAVVVRNGRVSMRGVVRYIRRRHPRLYDLMLEVYGCGDESCLARSMSSMLAREAERFIFSSGGRVRAGEIADVLRDSLPGWASPWRG